jgi:hypothetical protein
MDPTVFADFSSNGDSRLRNAVTAALILGKSCVKLQVLCFLSHLSRTCAQKQSLTVV